jgi:hypothetical protein
MKVKEQLAIYTKALEAEEQFRIEVNARIDSRIATIHDLIDGTRELIALGEASEPEVPIDDDDESEPEHHESSTTKKSKKKLSTSSKKVTTKKSSKKVKVFTKSSGVPPKGKKGAEVQRPRLEDSIQIVMGGKELSAPEIHTELKNRHWIPDSKDPLGYIRYSLSANSAIFLRREGVRGKYHLDPRNPYATGKHKGPIEGHINPKSKSNKKGQDQSPDSVEPIETATIQPPSSAPKPILTQDGQREDPANVVADLLKDGGMKAFGRQAPPLTDPTIG